MRNLKKVLGLVLCLAMMLSIMVVGAGAAFADQSDIDTKHTDAVDMCAALNIITGFENGKFMPNDNVTREQMAKMICVLDNGGKDPQLSTGNTFTDVPADRWSNKYIESCAARGVVVGTGNNKFSPAGKVTATQAAKMLLVELGYDDDIQKYSGSNWATQVNIDATKKGYYKDLEDIDVNAPLTREHAAQMIWNALQANEVEYNYTLVTNPDGSISSKVTVKDKFQDADNKDGLTLLEDKYGASVEIGYLIGISYDSDKGEYSYDLTSGAVFGGDRITEDAVKNPTVKSDADYSDLFGMKVKVVYKDKKDIFGLYAYESEKLTSGIVVDLPEMKDAGSKTVKIDGTSYSLDKSVSNVQVYQFNKSTAEETMLQTYEANTTNFYSFDLIDNDDNGKANCMVVHPVEIGQITYQTGDKFTVKIAGVSTTKTLDDVDMYDGVAKDDYVVIVPEANALGDKDVYTKLDTVVSGSVSGTKSGSFSVDGTFYDYANKAVNVPKSDLSVKAGDTVKEAAIYNGFAFDIDATSAVKADDYVLITGFKPADNMDKAQVKLLFTDGTEAKVTLDDSDSSKAKYDAVCKLGENAIGALYTYEVSKDKYTLTPAITDQDDNKNKESGFKEVLETLTYTYAKDMKSTIGSSRIDPTAIVFLNDNGDYKVVTGEKLAKTQSPVDGKATVTIKNAYADKNDSTGYSTAMLINAEGKVKSSDTQYGYIVSDVATVKNADDEDVLSFTIFNGEKEVDVLSIKSDVSSYASMEKGTVIAYVMDGDAIDIDNAYTLNKDNSRMAAVTAYSGEGSDEISYRLGMTTENVPSGETTKIINVVNKEGSLKSNVEIDKDTVIICVDNDAQTGIPGGVIDLATETPAGNFYANAFILSSDSDKTVDLIIYGNDLLNQM